MGETAGKEGTMKAADTLSYRDLQTLAMLGERLRVARQRRGQRISDWAASLTISENTVKRMEAGDPGVALGTYVAALSVINPDLPRSLCDLVAPESDHLGADMSRFGRGARVRIASIVRPALIGG